LGNFWKLLFSGLISIKISIFLENNSPIFLYHNIEDNSLDTTHGIDNFLLMATEIGFPKG
jgi:hypothetical protein